MSMQGRACHHMQCFNCTTSPLEIAKGEPTPPLLGRHAQTLLLVTVVNIVPPASGTRRAPLRGGAHRQPPAPRPACCVLDMCSARRVPDFSCLPTCTGCLGGSRAGIRLRALASSSLRARQQAAVRWQPPCPRALCLLCCRFARLAACDCLDGHTLLPRARPEELTSPSSHSARAGVDINMLLVRG